MGTFQTFTSWTFLTSGLVYQVLFWLPLRNSNKNASYNECNLHAMLFLFIFCLGCYQIRTRKEILDGWIKPRLHFPTMVLVGPETLQASGTVVKSSQVESDTFMSLQLMLALQDQSLCSLSGNYDGKWETTNCFKSLGYICEMTGGQNPKPTSAPGQTSRSLFM